MASSCKRRICSNEKHGVRKQLESWRSKLVHCVGVEKTLSLIHRTKILEDLRFCKDYKTASVSNWSFDENCLFCCLRREKVKEHVVALNNKIVQSGGKPLLGKEHCNISRLEWQVEEFLNAVLHRKEYTPRIPDPHIPVVACDHMQQLIGHLLPNYTSNNSQGSPRQNGNMDHSLLKSRSITSPTIAATAAATLQSPVLSKLLMADQDAPLDLSVKKGKAETGEQDGVLDLSIRKTCNKDTSLGNPQFNFTTPVGTRESSDRGIVKVEALQSTSTLHQFMAKLCLHHQQQIVDAFEFLQTEVDTVASSAKVQLASAAAPDNLTVSSCSCATSEEQSEELQPPSVAESVSGAQESPAAKSKEAASPEQLLESDGASVASDETERPSDLSKVAVRDELLPSNVVADEFGDTNTEPKCPTLVIMKNRSSGSLEAKAISEEGSNTQQPNADTLDQNSGSADTQLQACSGEHAAVEQSSPPSGRGNSDPKCGLPARGSDSLVQICTVKRNACETLTNLQRTARKSRASLARTRDSPSCRVINDPDVNYDIVYVRKPITECEFQPQNRILPRKNARKSTRGHLYNGECREIRTVRTLAPPKSVENGGGNCPVPEMTSVTPKQALAKPDGVPAMDVPFAGDCMETVLNNKTSDPPADPEMAGDVVEKTSDDFMVEPSQTGQIQSKEQTSLLLTNKLNKCDAFVPQNCSDVYDDGERTPSKSNLANSDSCEKVDLLIKETPAAPTSGPVFDGFELEVETLRTNKSVNTVEGDPFEAGALQAGNDLVNQNISRSSNFQSKSLKQVEHLTTQLTTCTDKNIETQGSETDIKPGDSTQQMKGDNDSRASDVEVEEKTVKDPPGDCKDKLLSGSLESPKKVVAKHALSSDRCLRSQVLKGQSERTPELAGRAELADSHIRDDVSISNSKQQSNSVKLKQNDGQDNTNATENVVFEKKPHPSSDCTGVTDNRVCTKRQPTHVTKESKLDQEQKVPESSNMNKIRAPDGVLNNSPENVTTTEKAASALKVSERMPLRNRSGQMKHSVSTNSCTPTRNHPRTPERMPLRSKTGSTVDQPVYDDPCPSSTAGSVGRLGTTLLRNKNGCLAEQTAGNESSSSLNARSLASAAPVLFTGESRCTISPHVTEDLPETTTDKSCTPIAPSGSEEPCSLNSESPARIMIAQSPNSNSCTSPGGIISESPGRMSLRSSTCAEKLDGLPTPPKSKKLPQNLQKMSKTLPHSTQLGEQTCNYNRAHAKSEKPLKDQLKESSSKFLEALNKDANRQLISELYTRYEKGWVPVEKDGQPAPKSKNKADRLKEIWKSKRRIRKHRSSERQKFSPVQMLFRKHFELSSICRWYLQSTETQSLDIVKKLNTRPPFEIQMGFQTLSSMPGSSDGLFPTPQAERLKKHLKKFAVASPVKCNAKNKQLIALAQGVVKSKEKHEQRPAARISSKPQSSGGPSQSNLNEGHSKSAGGAKNPASARILRKYSNMREKKQVQQISLKNKQPSGGAANKKQVMPKNLAKDKLSTSREKKPGVATKKAKAKSGAKKKIPKSGAGRVLRDLNERDGVQPKALKSHPVAAAAAAAAKTVTRKEQQLAKAARSPQTNPESKKSPSAKASEGLASQSQNVNLKPVSEDQVLTRSQRKSEAALAQLGSPKALKKRGSDALVSTAAKRTRLSK